MFRAQTSAKNNIEKEQIQLTVHYQDTFLAEGRALNIISIHAQQHHDLEP